ncbi:hypothetical protein Tco_1575556 [Tanacetum coccineum]
MGNNNASGSGTLPSNTIPNPRNEVKAITTRSGVVLDGPLPPMPPPYVNPDNEKAKETEVTKDKVQPKSSQSTANVQPRVDHGEGKDKLKDNEKGMNEKEKDDEVRESVFEKILIDKEEFFLPKTPPIKPNKPTKTLPYPSRVEYEKKGAGINLMPLGIYQKLKLPELVTTKMTLELANGSLAIPTGIAEDVLVKGRARIRDGMGKDSFKPGRRQDKESIHMEDIQRRSHSNPKRSSSEASEYSLDEFANEFALIDFSSYLERDDMTPDDVIEFLLYDDMSFSPKELNLESLPKDDFDNDDDLFEMDSNNDEWKRILYGEDFERMDSDSDKTKDFDKSSSSVFKSLSDEFEPGGSSYVEGNDLVCYEDFHVSDALFSTINEDKVFNPGILVDKNSKVHEPNVLPTLPTRSSEMMLDFDLENFQVEPKNDILNPKVLVFDPGILDVFDPLHPPLIDFHVTKALSGFTFSLLKIFSKKFFEPRIKNAMVFRILEDSWFKIVEEQSNAHNFH